jgi:hypothetical protein
MTYKVKSVKLDGLKAVITVENTHPDVTAIIGPILAMALTGVLTGGNDDAKEKGANGDRGKAGLRQFSHCDHSAHRDPHQGGRRMEGLQGARSQVEGYASPGGR